MSPLPSGLKVRAAFTASNPNDPLVSLNADLFHPLPSDAPWIGTIIALSVFWCESYMGPVGLAKATIDPKFHDRFKSIYDRSYGSPPGDPHALEELLIELASIPNIQFLGEELRNPSMFEASDYGRCLAENETYRHDFKTSIHMYYGTSGEGILIRAGRLAYEYHLAMNGTPDAETDIGIMPIVVDGGTHRLTFINAAHDAKSWIDQTR